MWLSPTGTTLVRGPDAWASDSRFGARRKRWDPKKKTTVRYDHNGVDLESDAWHRVIAPDECIVTRVGFAYPSYREKLKGAGFDKRYHSVVLTIGDHYKVRLLYVWPFYPPGTVLHRGQPLGVIEDLTCRYIGITNHTHMMAWKKGTLFDALPLLEAV